MQGRTGVGRFGEFHPIVCFVFEIAVERTADAAG